MSTNLSLNKFSKYITGNVEQIGEVRREVEEIQVGFNSAYVEWKAEHDATLERLVEAVTGRLDEVGPDLRTRVEARIPEEERIVAERRQELRERLVPETQTEADTTLQQGQELTTKLRQMNPQLDQREEELKAQKVALEQELNDLNEQIRRLSGCLGVVFNFFKIGKLDRQRQQVIGQLKGIQQQLKRVREEWQEFRQQIQAEQDALQAQWQEQTLRLAQLQGELEYLDAEANRELLATKRAIRYVIDNLKEAIPCPAGDVKRELDDMVELNVQTDDYQEGLGSVGSLLSLLDGIVEGLNRFDQSVHGLIEEQRMHSAYLSDLDIFISDEVQAFHAQWQDLAQKVRDDGHLCNNPTEFLAIVRPVMENDLSEANIKAMFDDLGEALDAATYKWR
jgi:predicted  nucleic acid-binding Zn-ribbon protein